MDEPLRPDLCVIGAGAGGLTVAAGAAQMGASVVLVEGRRMGGDCLNWGCVPSKALLAAAHAAEAARRAARLGVAAEPAVDWPRVHAHIHGAIAAIAPQDSQERFEALGVTVIRARARFTGPDEAVAGERRLRPRRFVLATGSSPLVPNIPGLAEVPFLTNETIFDLPELPGHLLVVGAGPVGLEMAQAFRRLGSAVTVLEAGRALPREDPELAEVLATCLRREGIALREGVRVAAVAPHAEGVAVTVAEGDGEAVVAGSHLLLAVGRRPNVAGLGLDDAGIRHSPAGIKTDKRLRTSNRRVYAIGDAAGGPQFTHLAGWHGTLVIKNALFRLPVDATARAVPRVVYGDPELAAVGLDEAAARERHGAIRVLRWSMAEIDRARTDGAEDGLAKVVTDRRGRILGAAILGRHAGELIQPWVLALERKLKIGALADMMVPYPALGEVGKKVAGSFYSRLLFDPRVKRVVRLLARFG